MCWAKITIATVESEYSQGMEAEVYSHSKVRKFNPNPETHLENPESNSTG